MGSRRENAYGRSVSAGTPERGFLPLNFAFVDGNSSATWTDKMTYNNIWSLETKGILVSFRTFYTHALDVRLKNNASGRPRRLDFDLTWG